MNNDNFLIEDSDLDLARVICDDILDPAARNRAVANALASQVVSKYFAEIEVDTSSGLHAICQVLEKIDISDIYINGSYVDVRVYFNEDELCVPKSHFDNDLLPVAYMFVKLDSQLSSGLVTGFITPNSIDTSVVHGDYYKVGEDQLVSYYDIEPLFVTSSENEIPESFECQVFDYLDNNLEQEYLRDFYKLLLESIEARDILRKAAKAQVVFNYVSVAPNESVSVTDEPEQSTNVLENSEELNIFEEPEALIGNNITEELEMVEDSLVEIESNELTDISEVGDFSLIEDSDDVMLVEDNSNDSLHVSLEGNIDDISLSEETSTFEINEEADFLPEVNIAEDNSDVAFLNPEISEDVSEQIREILPEESIVEEITPEYEVIESSYNEVETTDVVEEIENAAVDVILEEVEFKDEQDFSTNTTPSMESIEEVPIDSLEELLNNDTSESVSQVENKEVLEDNLSEQIGELYADNQESSSDVIDDTFVGPVKKGGIGVIPMLAFVAILGAAGYFGYTKYYLPSTNVEDIAEAPQTIVQPQESKAKPTEVAMPVETVENVKAQKTTNEGNSVSIPAIEQNLDASILVSNLSVNWEVPTGFVSNSSARRYFTKIGKIIQLNLKSELLLLSKPPISNKIILELQFNKNSNKFEIKEMSLSSGEKLVDEVITQTVKSVLNMNLSTNMSSFGNIQGNPVLIIRL